MLFAIAKINLSPPVKPQIKWEAPVVTLAVTVFLFLLSSVWKTFALFIVPRVDIAVHYARWAAYHTDTSSTSQGHDNLHGFGLL